MKTTKRTDYVEKRTTEWEGQAVVEDFLHANDIALVKEPGSSLKDIVFVSGAEAVQSVVDAVVNTARGEMQMDTTAGIPYFENVFGNNGGGDLADWVGYMQSAIEKTNGVTGISSFEYSVNPYGNNRREISYTAKILTKYGPTAVTNVVQ